MPSSSEKELILQRLVIVDEKNHVRAVLGTKGGGTALEMMNNDGVVAGLHVDSNGTSMLILGLMTNHVPQIQIAVENGQPRIRVTDSESNLRLAMAVLPEIATIQFYLPPIKYPAATFAAGKDKGTGLMLCDTGGMVKLVIETSADGEIRFLDGKGSNKLVISSSGVGE